MCACILVPHTYATIVLNIEPYTLFLTGARIVTAPIGAEIHSRLRVEITEILEWTYVLDLKMYLE